MGNKIEKLSEELENKVYSLETFQEIIHNKDKLDEFINLILIYNYRPYIKLKNGMIMYIIWISDIFQPRILSDYGRYHIYIMNENKEIIIKDYMVTNYHCKTMKKDLCNLLSIICNTFINYTDEDYNLISLIIKHKQDTNELNKKINKVNEKYNVINDNTYDYNKKTLVLTNNNLKKVTELYNDINRLTITQLN